MKTGIQRLQHFLSPTLALSVAFATALLAVAIPHASAASAAPAARITAEVSSSQMTPLKPSQRAVALAKFDAGKLATDTKLQGMSIHFNRTPAQEAALKTLMAAQQNPSSPSYHKWLTPEQFGAQFGLSDADIAKVETWLEQQGFAVDSVNRGKTEIRFSGTVGQANAAFATEIHTYSVKTATGAVEKHFAPSTTLSVPSAIAGVVESVHNLDDFRPKPHIVLKSKTAPKPKFSGYDDSIYFSPGDIAMQYDIQKAYNAGYTGTGQSIAVVGQSEITVTDIEAFQSAAGLTVKDPNLVLVPNTGSAVISTGDETESDLDLEWSGAIAKGATISLVYTGQSSNTGAFDALEYAIDNKIANIVSSSYGTCEAELDGYSLETAFDQASTQGQTVVSAAGDDGSTDCYGDTDLSTSDQEALAVDYPGSSPNVTSVGGTEIAQSNSAYETQGSAYWEESNGSTDIVASLLQPVPEQAWNEDSTCAQYTAEYGSSPICAGGGGTSTLFAKPSWQTGVTGLNSSITMREVPDIALDAAVFNPGYLFCSSDSGSGGAWEEGQTSSCTSGFRDSSSGDITTAGGTSFAAPIFAGMVAIINQQQNYTTGQGLINPTLYSLAAGSSYSTAFNDIGVISGSSNACQAGSDYCSSAGESGFATTVGYDQATGLGTINLASLASIWPANSGATLIGTTTTVTATNTAPTINTSDTFTITVAADSGTTVPSGTVNVSVDGGAAVAETLTANGTYVYTTTFTTTGSHTVVAEYTGNSTYATSTGSATVTAAGTTSGTGTFALGSTNLTVSQGSEGSSTITVTPAGGYTGTVYLSFDTSNDTALENLCYEFTNTLTSGDGSVSVTGTAAVTTQLELDTNASDCESTAAVRKTGKQSFRTRRGLPAARTSASNSGAPASGGKTAPAAIAFAGLLLAGLFGRYSKKFRSLAAVIALVAIGLAVSACGGGGNSNTISNPGKGTYTITVTGQDSTNASIPTATTKFTFVID
jgi:subtilase family serine protease